MKPIELDIVNPNRPDVIALISELDSHLSVLYPPQSTHLLNIEALIQPNIRFVLALVDAQAAGCGALRLVDGYAEVKRMYVRSQLRGLGVGYRILTYLTSLARDSGFSCLRLETGIYQTDAIKLYDRHGFKRCPPFGEYTDDPLSLCYEKHLLAE